MKLRRIKPPNENPEVPWWMETIQKSQSATAAVKRLDASLRHLAARYFLVELGVSTLDLVEETLKREEILRLYRDLTTVSYVAAEHHAFYNSFQTLRHLHRETLRDEVYSVIPRPTPLTFTEFWNVTVTSFYNPSLRRLLERDDELEIVMEAWNYGCSDFIHLEEYEVSCRLPWLGSINGKHVLLKPFSLCLEDIEHRPHLQKLSLNGCFSKRAAQQSMRDCRAIITACQSAQFDLVDSIMGESVDIDQSYLLPLCQRMIEYYYEHQPAANTKSKLALRIWNAIDLLMRSVNQPPAIVVGLCVAGIEAVVSDAKEGVGDAVSRKFAMLLESDKHSRGEARKFMKKLYNQRSSVFHGSSLEATHEIARQARCALVATIESAIGFRDFYLKMGNGNSKQDLQNFISELDSAGDTAAHVPGCVYDRAASLWRPKTPEQQ